MRWRMNYQLSFENCPGDYNAEYSYLVVKDDGNEILRTIVGMNDDLDEILLTELGMDSSELAIELFDSEPDKTVETSLPIPSKQLYGQVDREWLTADSYLPLDDNGKR